MYHLVLAISYYVKYDDIAPSDQFTFQKFSMQWMCIIMFFVCFPILFIRKIKILVKIGQFGAISVYGYVFFIIYLFFENMWKG